MSEQLLSWLFGDLSPAARVWTAALPALLLAAWVFGGAVIYAIRNALRGSFVDREVEARGSSAILGMWVRQYFAWTMSPFVRLLLGLRLPANAITTLSVLLATGSGVALAAGRFALGGWLLVGASVCDFLDGRIARLTETAGPRGAVLDSVLDRVAEAAVFLGLAWFYRDSWVLFPVLLGLVGSLLVSYVRARGEALGARFEGVGLMQRPERIVVLGGAIALSPILEVLVAPNEPRPMHWLAVAGILVVAATTLATALQRLLHAMRFFGGVKHTKRWLGTGRGSTFRAVISAAVATGLDFALFWALLSMGVVSAPVATFFGALFGAAVNFSLNRIWAFGSRGGRLGEAGRYGVVSLSSALLNAGGVKLLLMLAFVPEGLAWLVARAAVFLAWNYPLHRDYVFVDTEPVVTEQGTRAA